MADVVDVTLKADIKAGKLRRAYYLYGNDTAGIEYFVKLIISKTVKKGEETYNLHTFEGKNINIDELSGACDALPFFSDYVCCTVRDLNAESLSADKLSALIKTVSSLAQTAVLVFYNPSIDVTEGRRYPTAKNKKLIDAVSKVGSSCRFEYKTPSALSKDIIGWAAKNGGSISKEAAVFLAEVCGCDVMAVKNEIQKLISYTGGEIKTSDINALCPRRIDATAFDLAKAIVRQDKQNAMRLFGDLMSEHTEPIAVIYAVISGMTDLYRARVAINSGKSPQEVKEDFSYAGNVAFRVDNAFRDVRKLSVSHMRKCMDILSKADVSMKSTGNDGTIIFEEALIKMLS